MSEWDEWSDRRNSKVLDIDERLGCVELWPTQSAGDGKVVKNNIRDGGGQGKASILRKAKCQQCGFPIDLAQNDHSGGSESVFTGAAGAVTTSTVSSKLASGTVYLENVGTQVYNKGAGCPLCFSKNSTNIRQDVFVSNPYNQQAPIGF
jgi:hypothetical protein